jgi:hypothetical protein
MGERKIRSPKKTSCMSSTDHRKQREIVKSSGAKTGTRRSFLSVRRRGASRRDEASAIC